MTPPPPCCCAALAASALALGVLASPAHAQLRIVEWNITNYSSGRVEAFETAIYGVNGDNGLTLSPDVIIVQEMLSASGSDSFLDILNGAPGSPGDWDRAPFSNGNDTDNMVYYRTGKVVFLGMTVVSEGGSDPQHPRDVNRYDLRPFGYVGAAATIACYSSHMKAGTSSTDMARRLDEAQEIRADAAGLPAGWHWLLGSDLNIRNSTEAAYQELVDEDLGGAGRFLDPIITPGNWNNNSTYRFVHSQDPAGPGGMDDRYDQILVSATLLDDASMDYIGNPAIPYSLVTWNDPNHSYRTWGNDGTSFNSSLQVAGNTMVGAAIAQALIDAADGAGHLPVYLDLRVPPEIGSTAELDFGDVPLGEPSILPLVVTNAGDVALWTADGIADLVYTMSATGDADVPAGPFTEAAGGASNVHVVTITPTQAGPLSEQVEIASDAPDEPVRVVPIVANVLEPSCAGDIDDDGTVGINDLLALLAAWGVCPGCAEDLDGDDAVGIADLLALLAAWGPCG